MSEPPGKTPPAGAGADQSMEDILASIRRILNEDEMPGAGAPIQDPLAAASLQPAAGPLILTEEMMVSPPALPTEPAGTPPEPEPGPVETQAEPMASPVETAAPPPEAPAAPLTPDALLAPAVAAAAAASVGRLLQAVSGDRTATVTRSGPSIEEVVREELRPLLKDWLDQHLPAIVERLVRAEIERVVGRALG